MKGVSPGAAHSTCAKLKTANTGETRRITAKHTVKFLAILFLPKDAKAQTILNSEEIASGIASSPAGRNFSSDNNLPFHLGRGRKLAVFSPP